jgi:heat-inducible transcriptional repressor
MAELEDMGVLYSPHTSAGRVPTEAGYRLYVDTLLASASLKQPHAKRLKDELTELLVPDKGRGELLSSASRVLAELTRMAGVVVIPRRDQVTLRQVEFLPLSGRRVLVVLVLNRAEVQNRVITTDREYQAEELRRTANYINSSYQGFTLADICTDLLANMASDKSAMDDMMQATLDIAAKGLQQEKSEDDYLLAGESNLLGQVDSEEIDKLQDLFDAFSRKRDMLHLLEKASHADGVQIFIGHESGYHAFANYSLVATPYQGVDESLGVLAVVGPTRMDYERVIPTVDVTARVLSAALRGL